MDQASSVLTVQVLTSTLNEDTITLELKDDSKIKASRQVLMEVASFERIFSGEEQMSPSYALPEDDPNAVLVVMKILHHKPSQLPLTMSTGQLFDLATICHKYIVTDIVLAHVDYRMWIDTHWSSDAPNDRRWEEWLWILHVFKGTAENFWRNERLMEVLAANIMVQDNCWTLKRELHLCKVAEIRNAPHIHGLDGVFCDNSVDAIS